MMELSGVMMSTVYSTLLFFQSCNSRLMFCARISLYEIPHIESVLTELDGRCVDYVGSGANLLDCSPISYVGISIGTVLPE